MTKRSIGAVVATLLVVPGLWGQLSQESYAESASGSQKNARERIGISWNTLSELADAHPLLGAADHAHAAALVQVDVAGAVPPAELSATAAYGRSRGPSDARFEWGLSLAMPLDWAARRSTRLDAARAEAEVSSAEKTVLRREVRLKLGTLFWELIEAQERVSVLREMDRQTAALLKTVIRRVEMGEVRPVEAVRISVEAERIRGRLEVAGSTLEGRRARLARWIDGVGDRVVVAEADLSSLPTPPSVDEALAAALKHHPATTAAEARVRSLAAQIAVEKRARMPGLFVEAFTDHELDRRAYGGGVSLELPLWNWNRGAIERSRRLHAAGQQQAAATRLELEETVIDAVTRCRGSVVLATRYRNKVLPQAVSAAEIVERTYALGEAALLEVIDARRTLVEMKGAFLDAMVAAHTDCSRLRVLLGQD